MPNRDSKLWAEAYALTPKLKGTKKIKVRPLNYKYTGAPMKKRRSRNGPVRYSKERWLEVTREFHRWKKTEDYKKWRRIQFAKQNALCYYCDCSLIGKRTNVEHIVPRSKGGTNKWGNLVLACWECNKKKEANLLDKSVKKELKQKHKSKTWALQDEIAIAYEIREHIREE